MFSTSLRYVFLACISSRGVLIKFTLVANRYFIPGYHFKVLLWNRVLKNGILQSNFSTLVAKVIVPLGSLEWTRFQEARFNLPESVN